MEGNAEAAGVAELTLGGVERAVRLSRFEARFACGNLFSSWIISPARRSVPDA
jgi:hypothetical protein